MATKVEDEFISWSVVKGYRKARRDGDWVLVAATYRALLNKMVRTDPLRPGVEVIARATAAKLLDIEDSEEFG